MRWDADPLWGSFYDWTVEHPHAGGAVWLAGPMGYFRGVKA